ncbi:hypothetical protein [Entomospira culicis]|nr:hypothetical protein [Entomospira culicis]WDI36949.1 hypothetical protein PVA46_06400 [Entomospira culicis]
MLVIYQKDNSPAPLHLATLHEDRMNLPIPSTVEQVQIRHYLNEEKIEFHRQPNGQWQEIHHQDLLIDQQFIQQLLAMLKQVSVISVKNEEIPNIDWEPHYTLMLYGDKQALTLDIYAPNASKNAHFMRIAGEDTLFLLDALLVQLIARPISSYYEILLPTLHINAIQELWLENRYGKTHITRKERPQFLSLYTFVSPYLEYNVDQSRLSENLLQLWAGRTPINVIYNYQPNVDRATRETMGLTHPQAEFKVRHQDGSIFSIAVGLPADEFHFYASEIGKEDVWLLPSDLAYQLLNIEPFTIASRAITLAPIEEVNAIEFSHLGDTHRWQRTQEGIFLLNQKEMADNVARKLFQEMLLLHYSAPKSAVKASSNQQQSYQIQWYFTNQSRKKVAFIGHTSQYHRVYIDEIATPFLIESKKLTQRWQEWQNISLA